MKSQLHNLSKIALGILTDVRVAYPEMGGLDKDWSRLSLLMSTRGIGLFTLDLPNLDSILLDGLKSGRLAPLGPCSSVRSKRIKVPKLFSGLWLRVFDVDGNLKEDLDVTAVQFLRQLCCLGKKIEVSCTPNRLRKAVREYYEIEELMRAPTLGWTTDSPFCVDSMRAVHFRDGLDTYLPKDAHDWGKPYHERRRRIEELCDRLALVADRLATSLGQYDPYVFTDERGRAESESYFRHGPGAVADKPKNGNKYLFPSWPAKLQYVYPMDAFAHYAFNISEEMTDAESPSRLIAVPKTAKAPRLIASEPTSHQWCQQILMAYMVKTISASWISKFVDFKNQQASRDLTVLASRDGSLATVDLSSASDRLSCWVVERMFRRNPSILNAIHASRTRCITNTITGEYAFPLIQRKFASQGTAITFPVQTLVFLACSLAVMPWSNVKEIDSYRGLVRVYGDDIIIPTHGYADLKLLLDYLGLKVNDAKSYAFGPFRESCGMDAVSGFDVTPVKPKSVRSDRPTDRSALIELSNNLYKAGLWHAASVVQSIIGDSTKKIPVVGSVCGIRGLTSFCGNYLDHLRRRWNDRLQREEVLILDSVSKVRRKQSHDDSSFFQFLTENPRPDTRWVSGQDERPKVCENRRWVAVSDFTV